MSSKGRKKYFPKKNPTGPAKAGLAQAAASPGFQTGGWHILGICLFLTALVWLVFGRTAHHEFTNYDDDAYVYKNPVVTAGLTSRGLVSAFSHGGVDNWVPLTTLSHMADCQFYGLDAGEHHLTNVALHTTSVLLLFLVLRQMTGAVWRSAFVAAVFAVHPLHVESVAWVAERKDTLSGLFFMLTLWAYVRHARRPESRTGYGLVVVLFACGLMSKPMLVTLPFVLLLLDYWPLQRFPLISSAKVGVKPAGGQDKNPFPASLLIEKIPLLLLAMASCILTVLAQHDKLLTFQTFPLPMRVSNALVSCVIYLGQMFYPARLAVLYPYPRHCWPIGEVIAAFLLLAVISLAVFLGRQKRPYLLVGWLWYLGMLMPVIGLVQVGGQAHADRYTYLPQIGLYLMVAWFAVEFATGCRNRRFILSALALIIVASLACCARRQTSYWVNSLSLWNHTIACTPDNADAQFNLGNALFENGEVDASILHFQKALAINPNHPGARNNLGNALLQKGQIDGAIEQFQKALDVRPGYAEALNNLGNALSQKGQTDEALVQFQKSLEIRPDYPEALDSLGSLLMQQGRGDEAIVQFQKAVALNPERDADDYYNLGNCLLQKGLLDEAVVQYQKAVTIRPDFAYAHNNLGVVLLKQGKIDGAIEQFQKVLAVKPDAVEAQGDLARIAWGLATSPEPSARNGTKAVELAGQLDKLSGGTNAVAAATLAAAYAEAGRFDEAVTSVQRAIELAGAQGNAGLVNALQGHLKLYQNHLPFHENIPGQ